MLARTFGRPVLRFREISGRDDATLYIPYEATGVVSSLGGIRDLLEGTRVSTAAGPGPASHPRGV